MRTGQECAVGMKLQCCKNYYIEGYGGAMEVSVYNSCHFVQPELHLDLFMTESSLETV